MYGIDEKSFNLYDVKNQLQQFATQYPKKFYGSTKMKIENLLRNLRKLQRAFKKR